MRWFITFDSNEEPAYNEAIKLSCSTKLKIKDSNTNDGKILYNENEDDETVQRFWKYLDYLKECHYINLVEFEKENEKMSKKLDDFIKRMDKLNLSLSLESSIYNSDLTKQVNEGRTKEFKLNRLSKNIRKELILNRLERLIDSSLDKGDQNKFKLYSKRRNKIMNIA